MIPFDDITLRETLLGVLSHELRTPITSIYGGAQMLLHDGMPLDMRRSVTQDIAAEAEELHRLVEDLLAVARVEWVPPVGHGDPVLLQRMATEAAASEERRWPGRRVTITCESDLPAIRADDSDVRQVLRNLIANAIKSSPPGTEVEVILEACPKNAPAKEVCVRVVDHGGGFPPGTGDDAFRFFHQSPVATARAGGTGFALYVASTLVQAHGGRVWTAVPPTGGSEVGFSLPTFTGDDDLRPTAAA